MADATKLDELWARLEAARGPIQTRPAERRDPAPGGVYVWPPPNELGLDWVVINEHPDDPGLVYVVPADGHPLAGLADVVVREAGREPLYLRCGRGAWIRRDELAAERGYRVLDPLHVKRSQEKVRQIVAGPLDGPSAAWEDEADPDYDAWIGEVTEAVIERTCRGHSEPGTLAEKDFAPWEIRHRRERAAEPSLAAAGRDLFADLIAPPKDDLTVSASRLPWGGTGDLRVVRVPTGVVVVFRAEPTIEPPPVAAEAAGHWTALEWELGTDRADSQAFAPWNGQQVLLRIGAGASVKEVTVPKP